MIIGSYEWCIKKRLVSKLLTKFCGTIDYHTHIRLKPIIKYAKEEKLFGSFIEIGCGRGDVAFELNRRGHVESYIGIDMDNKAIKIARKIKYALGIDNITFISENAFDFLNKSFEKSYDYVILYDFLEHIPKPEQFLEDLEKSIGGVKKYIVSVPTPRYPKVFGRKFHESIGHLVDGYNKSNLDYFFDKIDYRCEYFKYNTGFFGNIGAYIFYHAYEKVHVRILYFLTMPFRIVDINSERFSSSLFAVYVHK